MEELIQKLQNAHGLTAEQSRGILHTITDYIKEKFPMVAGAVDNLFQSGSASSAAGNASADANTAQASGSVLDRISDFVPGSTGEKIEDFAKDKLGGFFGGKKTT